MDFLKAVLWSPTLSEMVTCVSLLFGLCLVCAVVLAWLLRFFFLFRIVSKSNTTMRWKTSSVSQHIVKNLFEDDRSFFYLFIFKILLDIHACSSVTYIGSCQCQDCWQVCTYSSFLAILMKNQKPQIFHEEVHHNSVADQITLTFKPAYSNSDLIP